VYVLLVQSGIKPAADVEVNPGEAKWFGSYLRRLRIRFVTGEYDDEHGSGVKFYFSKDASKAEARLRGKKTLFGDRLVSL